MTTADTTPAQSRRERILAMLAEGKSMAEAAAAEGISKQRVSQISQGATLPRGRRPGNRTGPLPPRVDLPEPAPMTGGALVAIQGELNLRRKDFAAALAKPRGTVDSYVTRDEVPPDAARTMRLLRLLHRRGFDVPRLIRESEEMNYDRR